MPCYHPKLRVETFKYKKAVDGHLYREAYVISPDKFELEKYKETEYHNIQEIPCGKCIGCRLDYSREWANRGYLEALGHENNYFVTITYDDNYIEIPEWIEDEEGITYTDLDTEVEWGGTLVPKDLTQFIKNVRQIMKREYGKDGIRFMASGEYGGQTERPHYHIIFFNLDLPTETFYDPHNVNHEIYYKNKIIERAWGGIRYPDYPDKSIPNPKSKGLSNISVASWNNIAYTARYITKKINGKGSSAIYAEKGQRKEFLRVSRMPGIGQKYYEKNWKDIYDKDEIIIKNKAGIISSKPPKYFDRLLKKDHPKIWEEINAKRKRQAKVGQYIKGLNTSLLRQEQLEVEERLKEDTTQKLIRIYEASC